MERVIVLGAGVAGLAAARALSGAGVEVEVIEARPRIGGRVWTRRDPGQALPIELGAEFIHGESAGTFEITDAAGLVVDEIPERRAWSERGRLRPLDDFWETIDAARRAIARSVKKQDRTFADFLRTHRVKRPDLVMGFVEGYHGAPADQVSGRFLALGDEETGDAGESGNRQFRIVDGGDAVVRWLAAGLDPKRVTLRLSTIAHRVSWKRGEVRVSLNSASGGALAAAKGDAVVVALPLGVLKTPSLRFDPPLGAHARAIERLGVADVLKVVFRFRERFWDDRLAFVSSPDPTVPTVWTAAPARAKQLTAWAGGPAAGRLRAGDPAELAGRALDGVARIFGMPRAKIEPLLESAHHHDWLEDPHSRCAYTYVPAGAMPAQKTLARAVDGTIAFAGEHTSAEETGTVSGAIDSGKRAASSLLRSAARR